MSNMSTGLRQRPTYSELIQEITIDKKIELPNRRAKFLRDSPYLTFLDSTFAEMDDNLTYLDLYHSVQNITGPGAISLTETITLMTYVDM